MRLSTPVSTRVLGAVALHGLVDFAAPETVFVYPAALALPDRLSVPAFAVCSIFHFAEDVGIVGSAVLHLLLAVLPPRIAMVALDAYFLCLHLPLLFLRLRRRAFALSLLFSAVVAGSMMPKRVCGGILEGRDVVLRPVHLKVVIAHSVVGFLQREFF